METKLETQQHQKNPGVLKLQSAEERDSGKVGGIHLGRQVHLTEALPGVSGPGPASLEETHHSAHILTAMAHQWRSLHTAYARINTLNRKTAKSYIKRKKKKKKDKLSFKKMDTNIIEF